VSAVGRSVGDLRRSVRTDEGRLHPPGTNPATVGEVRCRLVGFNGWPTFLERDLLEITLPRDDGGGWLGDFGDLLRTDWVRVADRPGMVTPRVVSMIINEAYFTLQEGTASREDIDVSMRLGTNYPHGPFAWAELIGLRRVHDLLEALWHDTHDGRYRIAPLLKDEL
ncbi:MAG: 3-hydroxyacyl-CoA dehydrogenase family protein, partial [Catalinimonas sp.]